ncbi:MAG: ribokinase [Chloroflexi bacterium]|nr:ribokinase [Chloroflexota bacterium]
MSAPMVVVGSLNMDLVARAPHIPQPGETIIGRDFHVLPGGKGANQAVAAARLGGRVALIGRVGEDAFATPLLANLAAAGVDHTYVTRDREAATGVALIVVSDSGQNSIVVASGANGRLTAADVATAVAAFTGRGVLLLQLETPIETVTHAARLARVRGWTVILNPAPAQPLPAELLALVDVLVPNETETALLTGLPVGDLAEAAAAAQALRQSGAPTVILTLGERGALLATEDGAQIYPAFEVQVVDTTAAGDAFVAGFAVALAEGGFLPQAVRWGNAAGALATTKLGAQPSLPTRRELEEFLAGRLGTKDH